MAINTIWILWMVYWEFPGVGLVSLLVWWCRSYLDCVFGGVGGYVC